MTYLCLAKSSLTWVSSFWNSQVVIRLEDIRAESEWRAFSEHGKVTSLRNFQEWNRDIFKGVSPFQEEIMDETLSNDLEKK